MHRERGDERPEGMPETFDPLLHYIGLFDEEEQGSDVVEPERTLEEQLQWHIVHGEDRDLDVHLDAVGAVF